MGGGSGSRQRLYCFPHGGGSAAQYVRWGRHMTGVDLVAVQLPGRGSRLGEPAYTRMDSLIGALLSEAELVAPYAFFGHSFGALVAYEVTHALWKAGRPLPERLLVSSFPAPHVHAAGGGIHQLPDEGLLKEVQRRYGGIPDEVFADPEMRTMAAAALRADYDVLEHYNWRSREPLPVKVTVLAGQDEGLAEQELATGWQRHTTQPVTVRTFPGGHFYLHEQRQPVVQRTLTAQLSPSVAH
nr:alpha/beta fold hydrolase [Streptomyces sp. MUSC 14]